MDREYQVLLTKRDNHRREQENMDSPLPSSYVITDAIPGDKPVWPPQLLLSIAAFALTGILAWLIQLLVNSGKNEDK